MGLWGWLLGREELCQRTTVDLSYPSLPVVDVAWIDPPQPRPPIDRTGRYVIEAMFRYLGID